MFAKNLESLLMILIRREQTGGGGLWCGALGLWCGALGLFRRSWRRSCGGGGGGCAIGSGGDLIRGRHGAGRTRRIGSLRRIVGRGRYSRLRLVYPNDLGALLMILTRRDLVREVALQKLLEFLLFYF